MSYFEAHVPRMQRNHNELIKLIKEVQEKDKSVEAFTNTNNTLQSGVVFIKDENICSIQFHEVPYEWSGCGYSEHYKSDHTLEMPFTADDVLSHFHPIKGFRKSQIEAFKDKAGYLKWCSYLKLYKSDEAS